LEVKIMNEPSNDSVNDRSGIGETITTALRQPSFLRVMLVLAATVVVFVGMRLAAPILDPILFAVVLALLFSPIYAWLIRHRIPTPLALVIMLVGLTVLFLGLFFLLGVSITRFSGDISSYTGKLNDQLGNLQGMVKGLGISKVDVHNAIKPSALTGAIAAVLSGVADFLSSLFLILVIVLFLLAEGPAMMNRLRASADPEHPQIARLTVFGHSDWCSRFAARLEGRLSSYVGHSGLLPELHTLDRPAPGRGTLRDPGLRRARPHQRIAGDSGGDGDQHTGRERALADADGTRA
jgi:hypothetical protein